MMSQRPYWCTKNHETAAMLVYQDGSLGVEYFFRVKTFFSFKTLNFFGLPIASETYSEYAFKTDTQLL